MLRMLSWGCGVQSTTLAAMSALGELEHLDAVITADPGWERGKTYQARDWYSEWLVSWGLQVEILPGRDIKRQGVQEHIHIPFWSASGGPLQRQCTRNFKIRPIKRRVRELAGYNASLAPHPPPDTIEVWIGFSADEWKRCRPSTVRFIRHRWPLIELNMTRWDCITWLEEHGLPVPVKSACIGCPYRSAREWLDMKENDPAEFDEAVAFDEENRDNPIAISAHVTSSALFIFRTGAGPCPLKDADLEALARPERDTVQLPMWGFIESLL